MKLPSFRLNRSGFTLIEILVVLAITAVLAGLAFPAFQRVKVNARAATCTANLKNLGAGLGLYLIDHDDVFPTLAPARADFSDLTPTIDTVLLEYVGAIDVFRCPADRDQLFETSGTSYFWNSTLNGQHAARLNFLGLVKDDVGIPVISDKENFHQRRGDEVNILYADGHIDKEVKFSVTP